MKPMDYYEKYIRPEEKSEQLAMFAAWFIKYVYDENQQYTSEDMKNYKKMFDGVLFQRYADGLDIYDEF